MAGYPPRLGLPARGGLVGVWGHSPTAPRGQAIAARRGAAVVRVEDAFLRSLFPGRSGSPALGLVIDHGGMHYAPDSGSDLLQILAKHPLDDAALLTRARHAMARLQAAHLTKYSATLT
ncbi:MAG: capsular polysaccharide biosynthesis protein, partial [Lutimaribacter sp.]